MELQLGLALPNNPIKFKGFDLNYSNNKMSHYGGCLEIKKKRCFYEAFENNKQTLPLLSWNDQPNDEDDDPHSLGKSSSYSINKDDGEGNYVVGWPPINSYRKKLHYQPQENCIVNDRTDENVCGASKSMFVKVKMEGVAIGRKIDLSLHHSYQTLKTNLIQMFEKYQENVKGPTITYQDREGDWLLVGDVPWKNFIESVQRLKILRKGDC